MAVRKGPELAVSVDGLYRQLADYFSVDFADAKYATQIVFEVGAKQQSMLQQVSKQFPDICVLSITKELDASCQRSKDLMWEAAKWCPNVHYWVSMPCTGGASYQTIQ